MKFSRLPLITLLLTFLLSASAVLAQPSDAGSLPGTQWQLVSYGTAGLEDLVLEDTTITLEFSADNEIAGMGGCNSYSGSYGVNQADIVFTDIVSTLIACTPVEISDQETAYFDALRSATTYEFTNAELTVWYNNNEQRLNFVSADPRDASLADTTWHLTAYGEPEAETAVIPVGNVTLVFDGTNAVMGDAGCNTFSGGYAVASSVGATVDESDTDADTETDTDTEGDTDTDTEDEGDESSDETVVVNTAPDSISFTDIVSTLIACTDDALSAQETAYLGALNSAVSYERSGNQLIIWYDVMDDTDADTTTDTESDTQQRLLFVYVGEAADNLEGSAWQLMSYGAVDAQTPVVADSIVTLNFVSATSVEGSGGCNTYSGDYQTMVDSISFSPITRTEVACSDDALTQQEQAFFAALESATVFEGFFDRLIITYGDGQQLTFMSVTDDSASDSEIGLPAGCSNPWIVAAGDTLAVIADTCEVTVDELLAANPEITDASVISVGQEIVIPVGEGDGS